MKNYQRFWRFVLLLILPLFLVIACRAPNNPTVSADTSCQQIKHDLGATKICGQPQNIVAIGPYMLDILLSLGVQPIGYAEAEPFRQPIFDNPAQQIPYLGKQVTTQPINIGRRGEPSLEAILQAKPDLILGENFGQEYYAKLSQVVPTLLFKGSGNEQWQASLKAVAQALGKEKQALQVITDYEKQVNYTRKQLAKIVAAHPRLLLLASNDLNEYIDVRAGADYTGGILEDLGFQLVAPPGLAAKEEIHQISLEVLPKFIADSIIVLAWSGNFPYDLDNVKQQWQQNSLAQKMPATRNGRVYFVDYHLWSNIRGAIAANQILQQAETLFKTATNE